MGEGGIEATSRWDPRGFLLLLLLLREFRSIRFCLSLLLPTPLVFFWRKCVGTLFPLVLSWMHGKERERVNLLSPRFSQRSVSPPFMKVSPSFTAKNRFEGRKRKATICETSSSSSSSSSRKMNERQKKSFLFRFFSPFFLSPQRTLFSKGMSLRIHFSRRSGCSHRPPSLLNRIPAIPGR